MNYAYWRKCDFQVHTPRDPNWNGERPVGIEEASAEDVNAARAQWADNLIDQCATKGVCAIAITDHHEMTMVPYVQSAIDTRKNGDPSFDLWLFPGMEITTKGGAQCIILFDSDLSQSLRNQAQNRLGISLPEKDGMGAVSMKVQQLTHSYPDIAELLDTIPELRGKYIVLPNVSQGNNHTVLKDGAHADFRRMSYVGGYLDRNQSIDTLSKKNRTRLSGKDGTWSQRSIYPMPTSDSRSADFHELGTNNTWIKIAEPTAEAIRQAFLGHQSRIRIKNPELAAVVVTRVEIKGSAILQNSRLSLSPEFNAIIGGRGSGKSTFLEYVAFALGRSCYDMPRKHYSGTERMHGLIESFISSGGQVVVDMRIDGAHFRIVRGASSQYQPEVTFPDQSIQIMGHEELRRLFPAVVYSQGELSDIGRQGARETHLSDLIQFVGLEYKQAHEQLKTALEAAKTTIRSEIQATAKSWSLQARIDKLKIKKNSLRQRAEELDKTLPRRSEEDDSVVAEFSAMSEFDEKKNQSSRHADQILDRLKSIESEFRPERDLSTEVKGTAKGVQQTYREYYETFDSGVVTLQRKLTVKRDALTAAESAWEQDFKNARTRRDEVLKKAGNHQAVTGQMIRLRGQVSEISDEIGMLEEQSRNLGSPLNRLEAALIKLRDIGDDRDRQTQEWAAKIESLSNGKIRARVKLRANVGEVRSALEVLAAKTGSHETTRDAALRKAIKHESVAEFLNDLRVECLELLKWCQMSASRGDTPPSTARMMDVLGQTKHIRSSISKLIDTSRVEAVATAVAKPSIELHYVDGTRTLSFEKASDGQRAAALLFMLLEQATGPLLIDQPEGDLDNRIITELTDKLHEAKCIRQLICASHNANLVVNGAAELVGHLDVAEGGQRQFECDGAIDRPDICRIITATMEGGEKAFKDRQEKYGY